MTGASAPRLLRTGLWRFRDHGLERYALWAGEGWALRGTILAPGPQGPVEVRYEVLCDGAWRTRRATVDLEEAGTRRSLRLDVEDGRWYAQEREQEQLRGCLDVDLNWSPSTNLLPIRRLGLAVGQASGPVVAAWVRFPDLALEPLRQEYLRLAERRYRYASGDGAFTAELEVDEHGLVVRYGDLWQRVAT